jgi:choline dehydrogenase
VVIIGAGSAGCVLAHRLSENPKIQVLILEAGEKSRSFIGDVPGFTMKLIANPQTDWSHLAEPDRPHRSRIDPSFQRLRIPRTVPADRSAGTSFDSSADDDAR